MPPLARRGLVTLLAVLALGSAPEAAANLQEETELAERYAPVVRIVEQEEECGPGEPYQPLDVDVLFDEPTVALRGPWGGGDLVEIAPAAGDLAGGLYEYHLDFPGHALDPGCDYERWARRLTGDRAPAVYAHVATDPAYPDQLALQYWIFYAFNDWNNLHEGDWEMIQLVFPAADARGALETDPTAVGYSQHEGAERADWGEEKLELVDGTHPVVYPAAGSHANFFDEALFIGRSAEQGVGCDDTSGEKVELRPEVFTIPSDPDDAMTAFPWIDFEGRWGELQRAFFNGPTGPNLKTQWTEPIAWSEGWRDRSYAVPGGGALGTDATDFFCGAVAGGSRALQQLLDEPGLVLAVLAALAALVLLLFWRATWHPSAPLRLARRRAWGQVVTASARMYGRRLPLFLGIGVLAIPVALLVTLLQGLVVWASDGVGARVAGEGAGLLVLVVVAIGTTLTLLGFGLVQAATVRALVEVEQGRSIEPVRAYRLAFDSIVPLLGALVVAVVVVSLLAGFVFLLPIAVWLAGSWALIAAVAELEECSAGGAMRRSRELVRGTWLKVASLSLLGGALALLAGPILGGLLLLATDAPLWLVNVVAGVVYALTMPYVGLLSGYLYFDARATEELASDDDPAELPAEILLQDR